MPPKLRGGCVSLMPAVVLVESLFLFGRIGTDRFPVFGQVNLERLHVLVKAQSAHGPQKIITVNCLAFFLQALVTRFGCDEGNEFRNAFLYSIIIIMCHMNHNA